MRLLPILDGILKSNDSGTFSFPTPIEMLDIERFLDPAADEADMPQRVISTSNTVVWNNIVFSEWSLRRKGVDPSQQVLVRICQAQTHTKQKKTKTRAMALGPRAMGHGPCQFFVLLLFGMVSGLKYSN